MVKLASAMILLLFLVVPALAQDGTAQQVMAVPYYVVPPVIVRPQVVVPRTVVAVPMAPTVMVPYRPVVVIRPGLFGWWRQPVVVIAQ